MHSIKRAGLQGEIKQIEDQIKRMQSELTSDYSDVEKQYNQQFVKVKTVQVALSDIDKYIKALDTAIMRFHSMKMDEINKIIGELWTNTYQGAGKNEQ